MTNKYTGIDRYKNEDRHWPRIVTAVVQLLTYIQKFRLQLEIQRFYNPNTNTNTNAKKERKK
jgi:hypothetical protein